MIGYPDMHVHFAIFQIIFLFVFKPIGLNIMLPIPLDLPFPKAVPMFLLSSSMLSNSILSFIMCLVHAESIYNLILLLFTCDYSSNFGT